MSTSTLSSLAARPSEVEAYRLRLRNQPLYGFAITAFSTSDVELHGTELAADARDGLVNYLYLLNRRIAKTIGRLGEQPRLYTEVEQHRLGFIAKHGDELSDDQRKLLDWPLDVDAPNDRVAEIDQRIRLIGRELAEAREAARRVVQARPVNNGWVKPKAGKVDWNKQDGIRATRVNPQGSGKHVKPSGEKAKKK